LRVQYHFRAIPSSASFQGCSRCLAQSSLDCSRCLCKMPRSSLRRFRRTSCTAVCVNSCTASQPSVRRAPHRFTLARRSAMGPGRTGLLSCLFQEGGGNEGLGRGGGWGGVHRKGAKCIGVDQRLVKRSQEKIESGSMGASRACSVAACPSQWSGRSSGMFRISPAPCGVARQHDFSRNVRCWSTASLRWQVKEKTLTAEKTSDTLSPCTVRHCSNVAALA
jgi:hypothetical protein